VSTEHLIRIMCPNLSCQRILAVPEQARGRIVRCRVCGMNIRIPTGKPAEPQPQKPPPAAQGSTPQTRDGGPQGRS
jgi:ribosomal protein S27E